MADWSELPKRVRDAAERAHSMIPPARQPIHAPAKEHERYRAMRLVEDVCPQSSVHVMVIDGDPPSKARPRFNARGRPYTPVKTIEGERRIAARLGIIPPYRSNVAVACIFFRASRQRIDVDNMLKAVLDAGTRAGIWRDDSQVTALIGIAEYDSKRPRLVVCFGEHNSTLTRGDAALVPCQACGKMFFPDGQRRERARWCSRLCGTTLAAPVACPSCGGMFKRNTLRSKYCSLACRGRAQTERAKADRAARKTCRRKHRLTEENVYILPNGRRRCRRCQADAATAHRTRAERMGPRVARCTSTTLVE